MINRFPAVVLASLALLNTGVALGEGSAEAGKAKSAVCAACHGMDGNSINPEWPSLAGQHEDYIAVQLTAFQTGERQNVLMTPQAMNLSDQDKADLAAYYAAQMLTPKEADPKLVERGKAIYLGGDPTRGISACIACHGPNGKGNPLADYPNVAGQYATYLASQLRLYASGERSSDPNRMMRSIASRMTDEDIRTVTAYMQGLR
ncbi:MAG: c-type cytochrome [Gammaproteobacteria bacterium]